MFDAAAMFSADEGVTSQSVVVVHTHSAFIASLAAVARARTGLPLPRETLVLSAGIYGATVRRPDSMTLEVELPGGFLLPPGQSPPGRAPALVEMYRVFPTLDVLFRDVDARPFVTGQSTRGAGFTAEPVTVNEGRPIAVLFHFDEPLESSRWRWVVWQDGRYEPFQLPAMGEEVTIEF